MYVCVLCITLEGMVQGFLTLSQPCLGTVWEQAQQGAPSQHPFLSVFRLLFCAAQIQSPRPSPSGEVHLAFL